MFRQKRSDTTVGTIEDTYGVNLNARRDMLLGNLLTERGFDSVTQLIKAYRGNAVEHGRRRRLFLGFHYEDRQQVQGFKLMGCNPHLEFEFDNTSIRQAVDSQHSAYIRRKIGEKINHCSVLVCLIGDGTAWRDWVDWEINRAL
jgi:Thoeris protein ThsB, TIR-like domain